MRVYVPGFRRSITRNRRGGGGAGSTELLAFFRALGHRPRVPRVDWGIVRTGAIDCRWPNAPRFGATGVGGGGGGASMRASATIGA